MTVGIGFIMTKISEICPFFQSNYNIVTIGLNHFQLWEVITIPLNIRCVYSHVNNELISLKKEKASGDFLNLGPTKNVTVSKESKKNKDSCS